MRKRREAKIIYKGMRGKEGNGGASNHSSK